MKRYLLYWTECVIEKRHMFSHLNEMNITTTNDEMNMTYEYYIKQPTQAAELRLNMIIAKNPHLINSLKRYFNHLFIRKYSHVPLNN